MTEFVSKSLIFKVPRSNEFVVPAPADLARALPGAAPVDTAYPGAPDQFRRPFVCGRAESSVDFIFDAVFALAIDLDSDCHLPFAEGYGHM
jgi:hypothetical protein